MKKDRLSLFCGIALLMLAAYWLGYVATAGTAATNYVVFSRFTPPDYRVPSSMRAAAHWVFEPAFVDSRFLRPAKWDALRPPSVLQAAGSQNK